MINQQPVPPLAQTIPSLSSAPVILGQAWSIYKQRLGTFLGVMLAPMIIVAVFLAISPNGWFFKTSSFFSKFTIGGVSPIIPLAILFFIAITISQTWGQIALLYAIKYNQERIGVIESYRRGWKKIFSYWWVSLLVGFIALGGFLLFIVPGIIFTIWFSLALFVLITEDLKGMNALLKSKEYVKGKFGSVAWRLLFMGALSLIISLVPTLIFYFVKIPYGLDISKFIIGLFLTPLVITYSFLVYSNLKAMKGEVVFTPTGKKKAGFILIAILGILVVPIILSSIVFSSLGSAKEKARDVSRQADITQIQIGLDIYYGEHNSYPSSLSELVPEYLSSPFVDPLTNQPYQYQLQENGTNYKICVQLESTKDQKCVTSLIEHSLYQESNSLSQFYINKSFDFPIPTLAALLKTEFIPPCETPELLSYCNVNVYTYQLTSDFELINRWFLEEVQNAGWNCYFFEFFENTVGRTECTKDNLTYGLYLAEKERITTVKIFVPQK